MTPPARRDGLRRVKIWLTLSSLSPLFFLLPAKYPEVCSLASAGTRFSQFCKWDFAGITSWLIIVSIFVIPSYAVLYFRQVVAKKDNDYTTLNVESAEDKREHLIAYLFAVFLPLYQTNANSLPALLALGFSITFIIWIFYFLNSYYVNPYFAIRGYRTYLITPNRPNHPGARSEQVVLLTKRRDVRPTDRIRALRLGEGVYLES